MLTAPGTVLLDTSRPDAENRHSLLFTEPRSILVARTLEDVPVVLERLDAAVAGGQYVAGYVTYEAGLAFEQIGSQGPLPRPLAWFGTYDRVEHLDETGVERILDAEAGPFVLRQPRLEIEREAYLHLIGVIREHIREGDVYQINFTDRVAFGFKGSPLGLYRALRRIQPVPYAAYLNTGTVHVLCLSPELFFRRSGTHITARPMKGTVKRGRTREEDAALRDWLAADAKSRAENLMIVDLLRNDLSRCCLPGSVRVPALFTTEPYQTLIQMTSTVEGHLRDGVGYADLFRALFPCGSVTGAPKIRAMRIIEALEKKPRGVYCGAIGYAGPDGRAAFNVAIRTVVLQGEQGMMGTGSGIVWDSEAAAEYDECLLKARFLQQAAAEAPAFELIETMRAEEGSIPLFELHVDRLRASVAYFGFSFEEEAFRETVLDHVRVLPSGRPYRVRVTLDRHGRCHVTSSALARRPDGIRSVVFAEERIDSNDPFRYHKTTHRKLYEAAYRRAQASGFDEVLFLNERGEVTEGSRSNVFVQVGGVLYTPPVSSGLLGGVYRRHLLETEVEVAERVLFPEDVLHADAVFLCNAVWGLQRVEQVVWPDTATVADAGL